MNLGAWYIERGMIDGKSFVCLALKSLLSSFYDFVCSMGNVCYACAREYSKIMIPTYLHELVVG